jgi:hypothetical protein
MVFAAAIVFWGREEALDGTQRDVERLEAAQEFTTRLLAGRQSGSEA